jgi:hypothetical protein
MVRVMAEKKNPLGPIGERLRQRVKELRGRRTYKELSDRLEELGRPIPPLGLSRLEAGERRVDVDDLVALSLAFEAHVLALILPVSGEDDEQIQITDKVQMSKLTAWRVLGGLTEFPTDSPALRPGLSTADAIRLSAVLQPVTEAIEAALARGATPGQVYSWAQSVLLDAPETA